MGNLHAQVRPHALARADIALAASSVLGWAGDAPALLGGDFNVPDPVPAGFTSLGGHNVDFVFARGVRGDGAEPELLRRGRLSDHRPVLVSASVP